MKLVLLALALTATAYAAPTQQALLKSFSTYVTEFNKTYADHGEMTARFNAFAASLKQIDELNAIEGSEVYGLTKFSDLTPAEFSSQYLNYKPSNYDRSTAPVLDIEPTLNATNVDWRTKGKVTPVKDQGQCGSCWAFSATEAIESAHLMAGKPQVILAPQQIVSCDKKDLGCNGGDTPTAYAYVKKAGGMVTEKAYPYTSGKRGKTGKCQKNKLKNKVVKVTGFTYATKPAPNADAVGRFKPDETKMAAAMAAKGPVSVCVDASKWQNYKKGILTKTCKKQLDHCVQAVGYNQAANGQGYWIVKNSWNTDWGIKGYIYVGMGGDYCGIANEATIATVA